MIFVGYWDLTSSERNVLARFEANVGAVMIALGCSRAAAVDAICAARMAERAAAKVSP